jgi:hypothetical protein
MFVKQDVVAAVFDNIVRLAAAFVVPHHIFFFGVFSSIAEGENMVD